MTCDDCLSLCCLILSYLLPMLCNAMPRYADALAKDRTMPATSTSERPAVATCATRDWHFAPPFSAAAAASVAFRLDAAFPRLYSRQPIPLLHADPAVLVQ